MTAPLRLVVALALLCGACVGPVEPAPVVQVSIPPPPKTPTVSVAQAPREVLVGAILPLTGSDAALGADVKNGIELALTETSKPSRTQFKLIVVDDQSNASLVPDCVNALLDQRVVAIVGEVTSSRTLRAALTSQQKRVPFVSTTATADAIAQGREFVFSTADSDTQYALAAAAYARDALGKTASVLYNGSDAHSSILGTTFRRAFEKLGGKILVTKDVPSNETHFTAALSELKAAKADFIFAPVYYTQMISIGRQAKAIGIDASRFLGSDGWNADDLLRDAGSELEGARFICDYVSDAPGAFNAHFVSAFRALHHKDPSALSASGFDGARVLINAALRAPIADSEGIRMALEGGGQTEGATGTLKMLGSHGVKKDLFAVRISGAAFRYAATISLPD